MNEAQAKSSNKPRAQGEGQMNEAQAKSLKRKPRARDEGQMNEAQAK